VVLVIFAITAEEQQGMGEAPLAGVERLIDQVLFNANVACQHESDEPVGEVVLPAKHAGHFILLDAKNKPRTCIQVNRHVR
jgi:hypothetical protein